MLRRLLPRETSFFDFFEQHAKLVTQRCRELQALVTDGGNIGVQAARIKQIEHETDVITHRCIEAIHRTFITPFDRSNIHLLIKRLDDIIDSVDTAASRFLLYEITEMRSEVKDLAVLLVRSAEEIEQALKSMRNMKDSEAIHSKCIAIYQLENDADVILRSALARLFKEESSAAMIIKWKEIYEHLEKASDRCEDVANVIQGVLIESS